MPRGYLEEKIASGALLVPAGISYRFAGNYEQNLRATSRLRIIFALDLAHHFYDPIPGIPLPDHFSDGVYWRFCCFCGWVHHAVAVWTTLVFGCPALWRKPARLV